MNRVKKWESASENMTVERTYSTREIAQMWNVSESTVKRWTDSFGLRCFKTPGGHRRFRLEDIYEFQQQRAFEATGLLSTEEWEDPNLEVWLNTRNFAKVRGLMLYLAGQNQRSKLRFLMERLYLRGMRLEEIYDHILLPNGSLLEGTDSQEISEGQQLLVKVNLEEALQHLTQRMVHRRSNGKMALCAAPSSGRRLQVGALARLLEIEGWESLNLGDGVSLKVMTEVVESEPVNLVCLYARNLEAEDQDDRKSLGAITESYRIPLLLLTPTKKKEPKSKSLPSCRRFQTLSSLRAFLSSTH